MALVGRPNVGKSSLFNRLLRKREALVDDFPGVTRDVKAGTVAFDSGRTFTLLDTGGLWSGDRWEKDIRTKVERAIRDVDLVLFCVDGREGIRAGDQEIAAWLRALGKPVWLVGTKLDDPRHEEQAPLYEAYALGFGEIHVTSANHDRGIYELLEAIEEALPELPEEDLADEGPIRIAVVGRPNVGKSSLVNALLGEDRVIVADVPGTTRDSVDVAFEYGGRPFVLVDTAGIRRKPTQDIERWMTIRSEEALRRADVCVLVVDPFEMGDHEMGLANLALERGIPMVMAVNKWDLVEDTDLEPRRKLIDETLPHVDFAPRVYTSALTEFGMHELLATCVRVFEVARHRVSTGDLNSWIEVWTTRQAPPNFRGKPLRVYYASQVDVAPPVFHMSVNSEKYVTRSYEQYLINRIREDLGFAEVPFRLVFKSRRKEGGKRVRTQT
ncbi:MAG: ribosome biogenesis GTPase Der [Trueperaceae bacterium]|nr:ribosome biogenesis GTPase Der [Trueperaceae bacterium]